MAVLIIIVNLRKYCRFKPFLGGMLAFLFFFWSQLTVSSKCLTQMPTLPFLHMNTVCFHTVCVLCVSACLSERNSETL